MQGPRKLRNRDNASQAERPKAFVPSDGGCADLGGYLAVWHGKQTFADGRLFKAGDDVWTVIPESD